MKKSFRSIFLVLAFQITGLAIGTVEAAWSEEPARSTGSLTEKYAQVPIPPGFKVIPTELEGPVFADSRGLTLYTWPYHMSTGSNAGDVRDTSACEDRISTKSAGAESPYPSGLDLPDADNRHSCVAEWPPVLASAEARPIGKWSVITRPDGARQWAYDHQPLYTSTADHVAGDVMGGSALSLRVGSIPPGIDAPSSRLPVGPPPAVPPGFKVITTPRGRMLITEKGYTIYTTDSDALGRSRCYDACARRWPPILAAESARPQGEWSIVERAPAVRQWAFRNKPLYTFTEDPDVGVTDGDDVAGWHTAYTQVAPPPPKGFTEQASVTGDVLADGHGKTLYIYTCIEDSADQFSCDTLDSPQVYRLAVCGGGDAARCQRMWPYVTTSADAKSDSRIWSAVWVDPATGHRAEPGQPEALRVWAYRGRPIYTYAGDKEPGDIEGHATGEEHGWWNGFRAFWLRDQFNERGG